MRWPETSRTRTATRRRRRRRRRKREAYFWPIRSCPQKSI